MKLRERPRTAKRYRGQRGPDKKPRRRASQYYYNCETTQSEAYKLEDYLLPPCSSPKKRRALRTQWGGADQSIRRNYDATAGLAASQHELTPKKVDRLYALVLQTHSLEVASWTLCIPYFRVQRWLAEGKKYAEDVEQNKPPRRRHALQHELFIRVNQAKFAKLAEKRALILQKGPTAGAFKIIKVLEALDTGEFSFNRGKAVAGDNALPMADEAYM